MRQLVTIEQISDIMPIPNADNIVAVKVREWTVVTQKDNFKVGDKCVYFEIDSFLPNIPRFSFLLKGSSLKKTIYEGVELEGIRLKTIKLRGQISQGLVMPLSEFPELEGITEGDVSEILGVVKYEPAIDASLAGNVKGVFPGFIPKTDEERVQNLPFSAVEDMFSGNHYVTEKLDGMSVTYYKHNGEFGVCTRNLELKDAGQAQWLLARRDGLIDKIPDGYAFQGEFLGPKVQQNRYKLSSHQVFFFQIWDIKKGRYLDYGEYVRMISTLSLQTVPFLLPVPTPVDTEQLIAAADGYSVINPEVRREGLVIRRSPDVSFKVISNTFLLNEDA